MPAPSDSVQNHQAISQRFCTKSSTGERKRTESPLFFIGSSPSQAATIISPDFPAAGCMVSVNSLRKRRSPFQVGDWMLDSGAFTEISTHGRYRHEVAEYYWQICQWASSGNLLIAVAQDWMCEPFVLKRTGLSVAEHQRLTIDRYDRLISLSPPVPIMPTLQGYQVSDYLFHLQQYGDRLQPGVWVGVGSVCRRNGSPSEVADILRSIKLLRPDLRLHGFGLKQTALEHAECRGLLYSCDSMAWSYPRRFQPEPEPELPMAHDYQRKVHNTVSDSVQKRIPRTAGAGNGQGRKPKWKSGPTIAIRIPEQFAGQLLALAQAWDEELEALGDRSSASEHHTLVGECQP